MPEEKKDKRKHSRLNINLPIKYHVEETNSVYHTIMHDISEGGIRLMSKIIIPRFKKIIFELPLLKNKDSLFTSGTLAWLKDHRYCKGAFEAGIKLNLFTETQIKYIKDFLHHLKKAD